MPETSRHLDLDYSWIRYSDKPYVAYGTSGPRARDSVELAAISRGGPRGDRGRARDHRHRQPEQPAGLGLPHGRRDVGLGGGQPADRDDAVPAGGRDRAGLGRRGPDAAGRRGALGRGDRAGDPARRGVLLRLVLLGRRHAQRRPLARDARVGARVARRRAARAPLRPAVPRRRRADVRQRARRAGGHGVGDVAVGHVPLGLRPRAARGRLARGRPDVLVREVRARPRGAAHVPEPAHAGSRSTASTSRSRRSARRGRAASSWPPTTRSSTSASGSS